MPQRVDSLQTLCYKKITVLAREQCTDHELEQLMDCPMSTVQSRAKSTALTLKDVSFGTQDATAIASVLCSNLMYRLEKSLEFSAIHCKTMLSTIDFPAIPRFSRDATTVDYALFHDTEDKCLSRIMNSDMVKDRLNGFVFNTIYVEDTDTSSDSE